jgi:hypothetical protein
VATVVLPDRAPSADAPRHVVVRGECLSSIARDELGDERAWSSIWSANRGRTFGFRSFDDPDLILPGWDLVIPRTASPATDTTSQRDPGVGVALIPPARIVAPGTAAPRVTVPAPASTTVTIGPSSPALTTTAEATRVPAAAPSVASSRGSLMTPPTTAARPTALSARSDAVAHGSAPAWTRLAGGLGAILLATGVAASLGGGRRRRLRHATSSDTVAVPEAELGTLAAAVATMSDSVRIARLELTLRALAGALARTGSDARPLAVRSDSTGGLEVVLDQPAVLDDPWRAGADPSCWLLPAGVPLTALTADARSVAPPCPALVGVGWADDAELYVDLEGVGVFDIASGSSEAADVVRLVLATLATTPLADELTVLVVGSFAPESLPRSRHRLRVVPTTAAALAEAEALTAGMASDRSRSTSTFRLRAAAGQEAWEPVVIVVPPEAEADENFSRLLGLAAARRGVAVLGCGLSDASWRLSVDNGSARIEPVGWSLHPHGLTEAALAALTTALSPAATDALIASVEATVSDGTDDDSSDESRTAMAPQAEPAKAVGPAGDWAIMVRVLGPVDVVDRDGRAVLFDRAKSLELVVWIAQHAATATRAGARAALWDLDVANASFSNVVSEARRALARAVSPPDGQDWIPRTYAERLPLLAGVVLDADLVAAHLARARSLDGEAAIDELRTGLALVRGAPYVGTSYLWPDAEALPSTLTLLATTVAAELATRCLDVGDVEGAFAATGVGLEVLPGHEELVAVRMRAHAQRADRGGIRREFAAYERAVLSDVWAGGEPSAQLASLRQELLEELVDERLPIAGS